MVVAAAPEAAAVVPVAAAVDEDAAVNPSPPLTFAPDDDPLDVADEDVDVELLEDVPEVEETSDVLDDELLFIDPSLCELLDVFLLKSLLLNS